MEHISYAFQIPDSRARSARQILPPSSTKGQQYQGHQTSAWGQHGSWPGIQKLHLIGIKQSRTEPLSSSPQTRDPRAAGLPDLPRPACLPGLIVTVMLVAAEFTPISAHPHFTALTKQTPFSSTRARALPLCIEELPVWLVHFLTWILYFLPWHSFGSLPIDPRLPEWSPGLSPLHLTKPGLLKHTSLLPCLKAFQSASHLRAKSCKPFTTCSQPAAPYAPGCSHLSPYSTCLHSHLLTSST